MQVLRTNLKLKTIESVYIHIFAFENNVLKFKYGNSANYIMQMKQIILQKNFHFLQNLN